MAVHGVVVGVVENEEPVTLGPAANLGQMRPDLLDTVIGILQLKFNRNPFERGYGGAPTGNVDPEDTPETAYECVSIGGAKRKLQTLCQEGAQ